MIEFTSDRKRMSVVVRDPTDNLIKVFVKGADSTMIPRLAVNEGDPEIREAVSSFVEQSSCDGLRTLLVAMKVLEPDDMY